MLASLRDPGVFMNQQAENSQGNPTKKYIGVIVDRQLLLTFFLRSVTHHFPLQAFSYTPMTSSLSGV